MRKNIDLSKLDWSVCGRWPQSWGFGYSMETGSRICPEIGAVPATVPGSVRNALLRAKLLPDWNYGANARSCEWIENRAWVFKTQFKIDETDRKKKLEICFNGLDGNGVVAFNGKIVGHFDNAFVPYRFDLGIIDESIAECQLEVVFEPPPRWLGQINRTSMIRDWKPRFNYSWDWTCRVVQTGIWDSVFLEMNDDPCLEKITCLTSYDVNSQLGTVRVSGAPEGLGERLCCRIELTEKDDDRVVAEKLVTIDALAAGVEISDIPVKPWWPNGIGQQHLYTVKIILLEGNNILDEMSRPVGFRSVEWRDCENAPPEADPWICIVNGKPIFLQGINWTPIRTNFADVADADYFRLLDIYQDMGCNILRVWGGAMLEKEVFYNACDERGLMIWQEFPLSSSGIDNWPPEDMHVIDEVVTIAESYITRRQHHAALIIWCGGNELQGNHQGEKFGCGKPVNNHHPLIKRLEDTVIRLDSSRRFLATSPSGPQFFAYSENFGTGVHWDVHGPWRPMGKSVEDICEYWSKDDSLFRSEVGLSGAADAANIVKYAGKNAAMLPFSIDNPIWRRTFWWFEFECPQFVLEQGREPESLDEYVAWSQKRQAKVLAIAAESCKRRFPQCGGIIIWMGHDCFPCTYNTSIIDFDGKRKLAAFELKRVFTEM